MSSSRIAYTSRPGATPEGERAALASVYRYILERHAKKEVAHPGDPDDAERRSDEIRARDIIPRP